MGLMVWERNACLLDLYKMGKITSDLQKRRNQLTDMITRIKPSQRDNLVRGQQETPLKWTPFEVFNQINYEKREMDNTLVSAMERRNWKKR